MTVKLTSIEVYKEDLALLEESVKDAETHEAISAFKQFKNPMVSRKILLDVCMYVCRVCMYVYVLRTVYCMCNRSFLNE